MAGTSRSGGRNAKPRHLHVLKGTYRATRHADKKTPEPPRGVPVSPKPLDGDALAEWDRMVTRMDVLGTSSPVHDAVLYQHCRLFAETEAQAQRADEYAAGIQVLEDNLAGLEGGDLVACFQEIGKLHALRAQNETKVRQGRMALRQYLVEFGMTPSALSRVTSGKAQGNDEEEALAQLLAVK